MESEFVPDREPDALASRAVILALTEAGLMLNERPAGAPGGVWRDAGIRDAVDRVPAADGPCRRGQGSPDRPPRPTVLLRRAGQRPAATSPADEF